MDRTIKFRGKDIEKKEWVYGYLYQDEFKSFIIQERTIQLKPNDVNGPAEYDNETVFIEVDPKTIGEFTGLQDKNKKDIYEDDIVNVIHENPDEDIYFETVGIVEFSNGLFWINGTGHRIIQHWFYNDGKREILGNRFETPLYWKMLTDESEKVK